MTTPTKTPSPDCSICRGRGRYEVPSCGDFGPQVDLTPCPDCNPVGPVTYAGCAFLTVAFALLLALLVWGAQ